MQNNMIVHGVISNNTFYAIQSHDGNYSIWFIDLVPMDMTPNGIADFMAEHCLDGCSVCGSYEEVITELKNLIIDLH